MTFRVNEKNFQVYYSRIVYILLENIEIIISREIVNGFFSKKLFH